MPRLTDFSKLISIPGICALLFLIVYSATFVVGVALIVPWRAHADKPADTPAALATQLADAKATVAALDARVATVQTMLTALTAVGTLLGLVVGGTTYFNLKRIQQDATDDLAEIRADFPAIGHLNHKIKRLLEEMAAWPQLRLEHLDETTYDSISPDAKQDLLVREMTFNGLAMFDFDKVPVLQRSAIEAYVIFGHFYAAWYLHDEELGMFERSVIYLNRALETGEPAVEARTKTALGLLYACRSDSKSKNHKDMWKDALSNYQAVLDKNPYDARCLIGVAYVHDEQGQSKEAIPFLNKVMKSSQESRFLETAYFNRACCHAKLAELNSSMADLWDLRRLARKSGTFDRWVKELHELANQDLKPLQGPYAADLAKFEDKNYDPA